jgi:DNA-binding response OmpR family regulator
VQYFGRFEGFNVSAVAGPCVLVVADSGRIRELAEPLAEPLAAGAVEVVVSSGGDDTIDLFEARSPHVVVVTATLELGDSKSLIETLRGMMARAEVSIVLVGDESGPVRTALDALEHAPDRFLTRPVSRAALRYAVSSCIDAVTLARGSGMGGEPQRPRTRTDRGTGVGSVAPAQVDDDPTTTTSTRAALRARWERLADSIVDGVDLAEGVDVADGGVGAVEPASLPSIVIQPRKRGNSELTSAWRPGDTSGIGDDVPAAPAREPTLILRDEPPLPVAPVPAATPPPDPALGKDFARQLREKMSMMAQRLFQASPDSGSPPPVDVTPRHDAHTEIDLASLADEPALGGGVTEIVGADDAREQLATSPGSAGSWETQVRDRGMPDDGEIVRGTSDAPMLLARMFAQGATGRIVFSREKVEKVVYFDQGRPVFASSDEPGDRMGELLVREGKITASQYERCQEVAQNSGRRMGEIFVDFGYMKRRELLPAVRRHVEDILYSLFGWDRGTYRVHVDSLPSAERIRLSRHAAALILEGIRRKLDRSTLERLVGSPSTVIEVPDRERLGGIVNVSDLVAEERAALAAFDGQADLAQVARVAGIDVADLLPLAWGLCVLALAIARRTDTDVPDESSALVGETDLAIDRERVRARWRLVTEADYFALLGVRRDATGFEIRRAYQSARRDFAADCFPSDLRRELAQELADIADVLDEAFRVLRDDRLRHTYLANLFE